MRIEKKELRVLDAEEKNAYLEELISSLSAIYGKDGMIPERYDIRPVLRLCMDQGRDSLKKKLLIDTYTGFPDESEISSIISGYDPSILPLLLDSALRMEKEKAIARDAGERIARGESPEIEQEMYRTIGFYRRLYDARDSLPRFREPGHGISSLEGTTANFAISFADYNPLTNMMVVWNLDSDEKVRIALATERVGPLKLKREYRSEKAAFEVDNDDFTLSDRMKRIVFNNIAFPPQVMKAAMDMEFPGLIKSIKHTAVGPFHMRGYTSNYRVLCDALPTMIEEEDFRKRYNGNSSFVAVARQELFRDSSMPKKGITFFSRNEALQMYLNTLPFPYIDYVRTSSPVISR